MLIIRQVVAAGLFLHGIARFAAGSPAFLKSSAQSDVESLGSTQVVKLSIGLEAKQTQYLTDALLSVSDPAHALYGKHLSREQAKALLDPHPESNALVRRWLVNCDISDDQIDDQGQLVHVRLDVNQLAALFNVRSNVFPGGIETIQALHDSVPPDLRRHVATIQTSLLFGHTTPQGSTIYPKFPVGLPKRNTITPVDVSTARRPVNVVDLDRCKNEVTPDCLHRLYNIDNANIHPHKKSLLAIVGFNEQAAQYKELEAFIKRFAPYADGADLSVAPVNGGENPQGEFPSGEANLDVQYALAVANGIPLRYYPVGGENHDFIPDLDIVDTTVAYVEPYLEFAQYLLDLDDDQLPQVVSISYGINEQVLPMSYARQVCNIFGQLGTRGVSIIAASGDTGPGASCQSNDNKNTTKFLPSFPASCPYVTAVGGTEGNYPEAAVNFSSGGFSEYFGRPLWQDKAVASYLKKHGKQWRGYFDRDGRGYPDVAAQAMNYQIVNHGKVESAHGTSASAPVFAAMISLLNNCRLNKERPALGFLNPLLYGAGPDMFTDITQGKSEGCKGESYWGLPSPVVPGAGWSAVPGWDPVTGLGTPLFDRLKRLTCPGKEYVASRQPYTGAPEQSSRNSSAGIDDLKDALRQGLD